MKLSGLVSGPAAWARLVRGLPGLKARATTLVDLYWRGTFYLLERPIPLGWDQGPAPQTWAELLERWRVLGVVR